MKAVVDKLSVDDMISIVAYLASLLILTPRWKKTCMCPIPRK
jgi:cytochrome c553